MSPIKVFDLKNTESAAVDYEGCGWSVLIVRHGSPEAIIYLPRELSGKTFEQVAAEVDFSAITWEDGARDITKAYVGMCSDYQFVAFMRLGEPDYKMVAYDDGETVIEHITGDLYIRRWTIVRLYDKDGEEAHILEACGDGRFTENDYNSYCAAILESYDAEDELIEAHRIGYVHELGAKWWVW